MTQSTVIISKIKDRDTAVALDVLGSLVGPLALTGAYLDRLQTWTNDQLYTSGKGIGFLGATSAGGIPIYMGTVSTSTPDPLFVFARTISVGSSNAHGITDGSSFTGGSYNSYDARPSIISTAIGGHYAGFQARPDFANAAAVTNGIMFSSAPTMSGAGDVDFMYSFYAQTPTVSGVGNVGRWYGFRAEPVTTQADLAWGVYVENQSYFGGLVGIGVIQPSARLHFAGSETDVVTLSDDSQITISTSLNILNFTPPRITLTAATGTAQYLLIRPVFIPTQNTAHDLYVINNGLTIGNATANAFNMTGDVSEQTTQINFGAGYTGTLSKVFGHRIINPTIGSATITTFTGINIQALSAAANNTSLLIGGNNAVAGNWAIYSSSSYDSAIIGRVGFGGVPAAGIHLLGNLTQAAWTTSGIGLRVSSATYTDSTSSGTVAQVATHNFGTPTLAASSATTYTIAETIRINGAPTAGTNVTLTNTYALYVASGVSRFEDGIVTGNTTLHTTTVALTNGAAAQTATMTNGPTAGNPTKWIPINDNGTTRYIPSW